MIKKPTGRFQQDQFSGWRAIVVVVGMLTLWAVVLGIGTILNGQDAPSSKFNTWKSLVIIGSLILFSAFWLALLFGRRQP